MKKIVIVAFAWFGFSLLTAEAQRITQPALPTVARITPEPTPEPEEVSIPIPHTPQAGDIAFGIDASPIFKYLGNAFNGATSTNAAPSFGNDDASFGSVVGIYGKYFIANSLAIRAKLDLKFRTDEYKQTVPDESALGVNPNATTVDTKSVSESDITLHLGYEWRRGSNRLQGFYGVELLLGYNGGTTTYDYGNKMDYLNQNPTTTTRFEGEFFDKVDSRVLETKSGTAFNAGLGAFVGVEYFLMSQISIGGEVGIGFSCLFRGQGAHTSEQMLNGEYYKSTERVRSGTKPSYSIGLDTTPSGNISIMFYF
ncbi:hypothetical protein SAMD00024442_28_33 [Candidatus Symbiothrix dinenymphae]|nr:hypothetical protein SAMD00024442_28_33 [Candidatus Symbiothrix dinenymphae]